MMNSKASAATRIAANNGGRLHEPQAAPAGKKGRSSSVPDQEYPPCTEPHAHNTLNAHGRAAGATVRRAHTVYPQVKRMARRFDALTEGWEDISAEGLLTREGARDLGINIASNFSEFVAPRGAQ